MALNVSYAAWAIVFTVIMLGDTSVLNMWTIGCGLIVLICGFWLLPIIENYFRDYTVKKVLEC